MVRETQRLRAVFDRDRQALMRLLDDAGHLCAKGSFRAAAKVFGEFRLLLERHLKAEADALEALAREGHVLSEATEWCAREHAQLAQLIERAWSAVSGGEHGEFPLALRTLTQAVTAHEEAEERELLPALEAALNSPAKVEAVVRQMNLH